MYSGKIAVPPGGGGFKHGFLKNNKINKLENKLNSSRLQSSRFQNFK
jgi:hypothetical protein